MRSDDCARHDASQYLFKPIDSFHMPVIISSTMEVEAATNPPPVSLRDHILGLKAHDGLVFKSANAATVRTTIQKIRPLYPERRFRTRIEGGQITVWRLDDQPKGESIAQR
jgi:hypothetical protein